MKLLSCVSVAYPNSDFLLLRLSFTPYKVGVNKHCHLGVSEGCQGGRLNSC